MKKFLVGFGILVIIIIISLGIFEAVRSDYYDYRGYVTNVRQDDRGNTIISTLSEQTHKSYVIRWYSSVKYDKAVKQIDIGDRIRFTTVRRSDTDIKNMSVSKGYSTSGKLVYVEGLYSPFVLGTSEENGIPFLVSIISHDENTLAGMGIGDTVRVFHPFPLSSSTPSLVIEAANLNGNGDIADFSSEDIAFIEAMGYKLRKE